MTNENKIADPSKEGIGGIRGLKVDKTQQTIDSIANKLLQLNLPNEAAFKNFKEASILNTPNKRYVGTPGLGESGLDYDITQEQQLLNLDNTRGELQPWYTQIRNGVAKGAVLAGTTFADGFGGTLMGALNVLGNMDEIAQSDNSLRELGDQFINNPFSTTMQAINDKAEELLPNYYTEAEQTQPWWNHVFTSNFLGDKFLKNFGFVVGAAYSAKATAGLAAKAMNLKNVRNAFKGAVTTASGRLLNSGDEIYQAYRSGDAFIDGAKLMDDMGKAAKKLKNAEWGLKTIGSVNAAMGEGRIEAIGNSKEWSELQHAHAEDKLKTDIDSLESQLYQEHPEWFQTVVTPEGDVDVRLNHPEGVAEWERRKSEVETNHNKTLEEISKQRASMANSMFLMNTGLLSASNMWQFGRFISGGYNSGRIAKNLVTGSLKDGYKASGKEANKALLKAVSNPFMEAQEEMSQALISEATGMKSAAAVNSFHGAKIDPEAEEETIGWLNALKDGFSNTYGDVHAWEEGLLGFLTGSIGMPGVKTKTNAQGKQGKALTLQGELWDNLKESKQLREEAKTVAEALNERVQSPEFVNYYQGMIRHNKYQKDMDKFLEEGNNFEFKNSQHSQMLSDIVMFEKAGRIEDLYDIIQEAGSVTNEDAQQIREQAVVKGINKEIFADKTDEQVIDHVKKQAEELKEKVELYQKVSSDLKSVYGEDLSEEFLEEMTWMTTQQQDWEKRFKSLYEDVSKDLDDVIIKNKNLKIGRLNSLSPKQLLDNMAREDVLKVLDGERIRLEQDKDKSVRNRQLYQNLEDMVNIFQARGQMIDKFQQLSKNPGVFTQQTQDRIKQIIEQKAQEQIDNTASTLEGVTTVAEVRNGLRDLDEKVRVKVVDKLKKSENPNLATVFKNYEDLETMQSGVEDYVLRTEGSQGLEDAKEVLDQAIGTNESVEDVQAAVQATIKQYQEVISQEKKKGADSTEMKRDVIWMEESVQHLTTMLERYKRNIQSESVNKPDPTPSSQQPKNRGEEQKQSDSEAPSLFSQFAEDEGEPGKEAWEKEEKPLVSTPAETDPVLAPFIQAKSEELEKIAAGKNIPEELSDKKPTEDLNKQREEIERKRKEELNSIIVNTNNEGKTKSLSEFNDGDYIVNTDNGKEYEVINKSNTKVKLRPIDTNFQEIHDSDGGNFILKPINTDKEQAEKINEKYDLELAELNKVSKTTEAPNAEQRSYQEIAKRTLQSRQAPPVAESSEQPDLKPIEDAQKQAVEGLRSFIATKYDYNLLKDPALRQKSKYQIQDKQTGEWITPPNVKFVDDLGAFDFVDDGRLEKVVSQNPQTAIKYVVTNDENFRDNTGNPHVLLAIEVTEDMKKSGEIAFQIFEGSDGKQYQAVGALWPQKTEDNDFVPESVAQYNIIKKKLQKEYNQTEGAPKFYVSPSFNNQVKHIYSGRMVNSQEGEMPAEKPLKELVKDSNAPLHLGFYYSPVNFKTPTLGENAKVAQPNMNNSNPREGSVWIMTQGADGVYYPKALTVKRFNADEFDLKQKADSPIVQELLQHLEILSDPTKGKYERSLAKFAIEDILHFDKEGTRLLFVEGSDVVSLSGMENNIGQGLDPKQKAQVLLGKLHDLNLRFQIQPSRITESRYKQQLLDSDILTTNLAQLQNVNASFDMYYHNADGTPVITQKETTTGHRGKTGIQSHLNKQAVLFEGKQYHITEGGQVVRGDKEITDSALKEYILFMSRLQAIDSEQKPNPDYTHKGISLYLYTNAKGEEIGVVSDGGTLNSKPLKGQKLQEKKATMKKQTEQTEKEITLSAKANTEGQSLFELLGLSIENDNNERSRQDIHDDSVLHGAVNGFNVKKSEKSYETAVDLRGERYRGKVPLDKEGQHFQFKEDVEGGSIYHAGVTLYDRQRGAGMGYVAYSVKVGNDSNLTDAQIYDILNNNLTTAISGMTDSKGQMRTDASLKSIEKSKVLSPKESTAQEETEGSLFSSIPEESSAEEAQTPVLQTPSKTPKAEEKSREELNKAKNQVTFRSLMFSSPANKAKVQEAMSKVGGGLPGLIAFINNPANSLPSVESINSQEAFDSLLNTIIDCR